MVAIHMTPDTPSTFDRMGEPLDTGTFWEERLAAHDGLAGVGYAGVGQPLNERMYEVRRGVFRRFVQRHLHVPASARVLDAGSGTGFYLEQWRALGVERLNGSDLTRHATERLSRLFPEVTMCQWDISSPGPSPFAHTFDAVSCMDVLFHVVDDEAFALALLNLRRQLKPGGLLFISDNFVHGPELRREHWVSRPLEVYMPALRTAGLQPLERRPMFVFLNLPVDSRSPLLHRVWNFLERTGSVAPERAGRYAGWLLPLERLLTRTLHEGPSTEIMACRAV